MRGVTEIVHELIRLKGDEDWDALGDDWWRGLVKLAELQFVDGYYGPPEWMRQNPRHYLDWGATLCEASKADVLRLIGARPDYSGIKDEWDRPFREAAQKQDALLAALPEGRYGVVWLEMP